jgi:hypothetical protein
MSRARLTLTPAEIDRLDVLLVSMRAVSPPGVEHRRSDVFRAVLARGFDVLAAELQQRSKTSTPSRRRSRT